MVQSGSQNYSDSKSSASVISDEPLYDSEDEELEIFDPIPYIFILKDAFGNSLSLPTEMVQNARGLCPPFHILLDHLIAVLWILYSKKGFENLRTNHIHWALKFLEGTQNSQGVFSPDTEVAIDHLKQALIEMTATIDEEAIENENKLDSTRKPSSEEIKRKSVRDDYDEFAKGITNVGGGNLKTTKLSSSQAEKEFPSLVLGDMIGGMNPEDMENLLSPDVDTRESKTSISDETLEKRRHERSKESFDFSSLDKTSRLHEEVIEWKNQEIQKMIRQLEKIQNLDATLMQLKCSATQADADKVKSLIDHP